MSEEMDPIKKDKIVTYAAVALVALDMVAMAILVGLNAAGTVSMETMLIVSTLLSLLMFAIIVVYLIYSHRARPKILEYKEKRDGIRKEEQESPSSEGDEPKE
ncbi:MAG: hypothetical protein IJ248_01895 [Candidatus Methanomethylophilaceae archaeon]|nr:hypothetical protein [Candidatus Methanomethylophilaceae archaeon]